MKRFRLLKATRQSTEYSCGASALQAVLSYWGKDMDEEELMKLLKTSPETGTYPEDIVRVAKELGLEAEIKENLSLEEAEKVTSKGMPVIVLGQAWRSRENAQKAPTQDWEDGHYVVMLAVDSEYVYYEDPYIRMGKGFVPRKDFEDHWHNIGGREQGSSATQSHIGIFIKGKNPAKSKTFRQIDPGKVNFSKLGPIHLAVISFKGQLLPYDLMKESRPLWESGLIRPSAYIFLRKDKAGKMSAIEGGNLQEEEETIEMDALLAVLAGQKLGGKESAKDRVKSALDAASKGDFGLQVEDILKMGERMEPDSSVMILLFEHLWAKKLRDIIGRFGGTIINQEIITLDKLAEMGADISKEK